METIGLFSGVLLFSVLCLLPEVRAAVPYVGRQSKMVMDYKTTASLFYYPWSSMVKFRVTLLKR